MSAQIQFTLVAGSKSQLLSLPREATIADVAKLIGNRSNVRFTVADGCTPSSTTTLADLSELCQSEQLALQCTQQQETVMGGCCWSMPSYDKNDVNDLLNNMNSGNGGSAPISFGGLSS